MNTLRARVGASVCLPVLLAMAASPGTGVAQDPLAIVGATIIDGNGGPPLADGRVPLILVSDNNFSDFQTTQFIALAVELEVVE